MGRKHTEENRFRFQTFGDRIAAIRIGTNVRIKRFDSIPDDAETFLGENLHRWGVINLSKEFSAFESQLAPLSESLALVYLHRQKIASLFMSHLATATKLSQEAVLDLLVHFARDMSSEFVPFAKDFIRQLVDLSLASKKDPDVLEWSFSCLAHLLKLLWKHFVDQLEAFLDILLPTFDSALPAYIRQFSAEAFAFLVRKTTDLLATVRLIVDDKLRLNPDCTYGLGLVIFEVVRGANKTLLPCSEDVIKLLIELSSKEEPDSPQAEIFQIFLNSCAEHISATSCSVIFKSLLNYLQSTASADSCGNVAHSVAFLTTWLAYRHGTFCCDSNAVAKAVVDALAWHHSHETCCDHLLSVFSSLLGLESNNLPANQCYVHVKTIFDLPMTKQKLFDFALRHVSSSYFSSCFLPHVLSMLLKFKEKDDDKQSTAKRPDSMECVRDYDLCDVEFDDRHENNEETSEGLVRESLLAILAKLALQHVDASSSKSLTETIALPDIIIREFADLVTTKMDAVLGQQPDSDTDLTHIWAIATITNKLSLLADPVKREAIESLSSSLRTFCTKAKKTLLGSSSHGSKKKLACLLIITNEMADCFSKAGESKFKQETSFSTRDALSLLSKFPGNLPALTLTKTIIDACIEDDSNQDLSSCEKLCSALAELLEYNLASPLAEVRDASLHILERSSRLIYKSHCESLALTSGEQKKKPGVNMLATLLAAERTPSTLQYYRDRLNLLQKVRADIAGNQPESINWQRLCIFSLVGHLSIDFSPIHKPVCELLTSYVENLPRETFWSPFSKLLSDVHEKASSDRVDDDDDESDDSSDVTLELAQSCSELLDFCYNGVKQLSAYNRWHSLQVRLWEALRAFKVEDLEHSSRYYVPLFLEFVTKSFSNIVSSASVPLVNLIVAPGTERRSRPRQASSKADRRRCLVTMLAVFSKLRHRSQLVSADKIVAAVFRLLKIPRPELQRPALDFLINTNWPGISVYQEVLTNLLEAKRYRGCLVELGDLSAVKADDRKSLLPVLLRLIFGQMHFVKNKSRSGKSGYAKKSASLAFMANLSAEEVAMFVGILLEPFSSSPKWFTSTFAGDVAGVDFVDAAIMDGVDPMAFPSTELQFWFFHTFTDCINNLHNVAAEQWRQFFRIALILYSLTCRVLSCNEDGLDSQHEKRLRRLRKLAFKSFNAFFARRSDVIEEWPNAERIELAALFNHIIWPEFKRCSVESEFLPLLSLMTIWASDYGLRSLLLRQNEQDANTTLMSTIFAAIKENASHSAVDLKIVDAYMSFFESLLPRVDDAEPMETDEDLEFNTKLYSHRNVIISIVSNVLKFSKKNKLLRKRVPKALSIFQRVTAKVDDPNCAVEVFQLLLSLMSSNSLPGSESQHSALKSLTEVVPALEHVSPAQLNSLALCFSRVADRPCRVLLCKVLELLGERLVPHCANVSKLILDLNSWSRKLDEPDYETRLAAFTKSTHLLAANSLEPFDVTLLLNNCLFFMLNVDDFSIRANSSELITSIIKWAGEAINSGQSTGAGRKLIVNAVVAASVRGMQHKNDVVRNEFLRVLAQLVRVFPDHSSLVGLSKLTDNDADADFFENMRHVQTYRRARAMRRLANLLLQPKTKNDQEETTEPPIGLRPLINFVMPLAQMYLIAASNGGVKSSIVDASLDLLKACCHHLPWQTYNRLLSKFISQLLSGNSEKITFNIRAVVAILDAYHFVSFAEKTDENGRVAMETDSKPLEPSQPAEKSAPVNPKAADSDESIMRAIKEKIVPNIIEAINSQLLPGSLSSGQCAVIPLAIAAVRLLIHCPHAYRTATVPTLILKLIEFLKSRWLDVRQTARKSLGQICLALGPSQFNWVIRDLRSSLTRGYQRHVLTFTVADLVRVVQPVFKPGQLDSCIKDVTNIFSSELFTVLSEEKEADCKVSGKWPEAKRRASLHAYPVLANLISKSSVDIFLQPLKDVLISSTDAEKIRKSRQVLHLIIPILAQNPGIALSDLVSLARRWLQASASSSSADKPSKNKHKVQESGLLEPRPLPSQLLLPKPARLGMTAPITSATVNSYAMAEFGLRMIFSLIKHNRLTDATFSTAFGDNESNEAALEQFADEVHSLMKIGSNESVLHSALQLASTLLTFKVPVFTRRLSSLADSVFELLKAELMQKNTQSRLLVACFKAAGILVDLARSESAETKSSRVALDSEQIDALLVCIDEALLGDRQSVCALQLLKKLLDSSLKSQQLAEIINGTITKVSIRGRDEYQPLARACVLSYMLHYPVGQKNLDQMLETFLSILTTQNGETHLLRAALEMVFLVVSHFPEKELERRAGAIFLPVAALFVNCQEIEVRELVNVVLVRLLSRASSSQRDNIFKELVTPWLNSGKLLRQQLAGHVVAAFVEAEGDKFEPRLPIVTPAIVDLIANKVSSDKKTKQSENKTKKDENAEQDSDNSDLEDVVNESENGEEDEQVNGNQMNGVDDSLDGFLYSMVSTLVKIVRLFKLKAISASSGGFPQLVSIAESLSLHAHSWIRCQIASLWSELFQSVEVDEFLQAAEISLKKDEGMRLKSICRCVVNQLLTKGISPAFSETVAANYVFLSRILLKMVPTGGELGSSIMIWFCRRAVRVAMAEFIYEARVTCIKRLAVYKWMAAFVTDLTSSNSAKVKALVETVVFTLTVPLSRELKETPLLKSADEDQADEDGDDGRKNGNDDVEDDTVTYESHEKENPIAQEVRQVCLELSELFRNTVGIQLFTKALNSAMKKAAEKKLQRGAHRASLAVTDPARAARLKAYRQASKREARKRRIADEKTNRGAGFSNSKRGKQLNAEMDS